MCFEKDSEQRCTIDQLLEHEFLAGIANDENQLEASKIAWQNDYNRYKTESDSYMRNIVDNISDSD